MNKVLAYIFTLICFFIGLTTINAQEQYLIDSLKKHNLNESNLEIVVNNNNEISYSFGSIDLDSSLFYSNKAMTLAKKINYKYGLAISFSYTARALLEKTMFKNAIENFNKSLKLFIEIKDSANILDCYRGLTYVYSYGSDQIKSLDYNLKALKIAEQLQDSNSLSTIYNNIGANYTRLGNYESAILYYDKTINIDEQSQDFKNLALSYSNLGILKLENNKLREAASDYNKILKFLPKINNDYVKSYLFLSVSSYYTELSKYDSAKYYIDHANNILTKNLYHHIQLRSYRKEAELYFKQKKYSESILYFDKCLKLSKSIGVSEDFPKIYKMKAEAYSHLNMYQKAYKFSQLANRAVDSLKNKKITGFLAEFEKEQQIKEETEKRLLEQALKDQKVENARIKMKFRFAVAIAIISLMFLTILVVIYFFLRIRQNNKKLKSQHKLINSQKLMLEDNIQKLTLSEKNLKKLNATKDKFFSIIAHDLRSPFNAILGFNEELMSNYDDYDDIQRKHMINLVGTTSQSTFNLLENLLTWARSQSGFIKINKKAYPLKEIVNEGISAYLPAATIKNIIVNNNICEDLRILTDQDSIKIVISNLFNNAVKFSKQNGEINLDCKLNNNMVEICIRDEGIGMSDQIIKELFDIEKNVQRNGTSNEKGTGLGLILCQEFIQKNNGKIWVISQVGKGSEFYFSVPLFED